MTPPLKSDYQFFGNLTNFLALSDKNVFLPLRTQKRFQKMGVRHAK